MCGIAAFFSRNNPATADSVQRATAALHLGSEVKALFAAGVPARWDHEAFNQGTAGFLSPERTLFEVVFQVPPGHYLLATPGSFRVLRY